MRSSSTGDRSFCRFESCIHRPMPMAESGQGDGRFRSMAMEIERRTGIRLRHRRNMHPLGRCTGRWRPSLGNHPFAPASLADPHSGPGSSPFHGPPGRPEEPNRGPGADRDDPGLTAYITSIQYTSWSESRRPSILATIRAAAVTTTSCATATWSIVSRPGSWCGRSAVGTFRPRRPIMSSS